MDEAIGLFPRIISRCRKTGQSRVLVDYRDLKGLPLATERTIFFSTTLDQYHQHRSSGGQSLRIAYLGSKEFIDDFDPGQDYAGSQGLSTLITADETEARGWL